ncbi:MAG TPA: cytochrome b N-terminal domain-containing protein [Gemmataceae bacterium]|jgi:ubiquinol-cytochrome c reductase cytochrome b subunit|nr:cytochrome b N-terminal domain-containing protein [Gemmataceae bacterium]
MIRPFRAWFENRSGLGNFINLMLLEHIPGGAKWRYVWGSALAFVFTVQVITGVLLMTAYSPSDSTAWSSVYFIQYEMDFGWLIRGLHHFGSQTMVVLLGIHMLQVVIAGAHLKPREMNWWLGLGLLGAVLGLSLTGYLLPWDQKGYWATQVATNIAGQIPGIGTSLQRIIVGGPSYGNHTLTRFFGLHVAILPGIVIVLMIAHIALFRRHGVTTSPNDMGHMGRPGEPEPAPDDPKAGWFWPDQAFRDMVVSLLIFGVMLGLVIYGWGNKIEVTDADGKAVQRSLYDRIAHAGRDGRGANLDSPADPDRSYPARPEWYFLFLFQFLKYFPGEKELIGSVIIPNGILILLAALPLLGYGRMRSFGRYFGIAVVSSILIGAGVLTYLAVAEDRGNSDKAREFHKQMEAAGELAQRSVQLAHDGIPEAGPRNLLRNDPLTRGKELFGIHCATCHTCRDCKNATPTASDLSDFGTKESIKEFLKNPDDGRFFGNMPELKGKGKMQERKEKHAALPDLDSLAYFLSTHPRTELPAIPSSSTTSELERGFHAFKTNCAKCHNIDKLAEDGDGSGPNLTGYGDAGWIRGMIISPHLRFFDTNRMPAFRDLEGLTGAQTKEEFALAGKDLPEEAKKLMQLSDLDRELIVRWLTKDYRVVFGGQPISGVPKK